MKKWDTAAVKTDSPWNVIHLKETESTNTDAVRLALEGCPEFTVVIADSQTGGRGRQGRTWSSPPASGLLFSLVLRHDGDIAAISTLPLVMGLAVAKAVSPYIAPDIPQIKWPNDILVGGRKLCGILCEMRQSTAGRAVIAGIGINVNLPPDSLPEEVAARATSMNILTGKSFRREEVFSSLLNSISREYAKWKESGFKALLPEIGRYDYLNGRSVTMALTGEKATGTACGIGADGSLLLREESGIVRNIYSGEAHIL